MDSNRVLERIVARRGQLCSTALSALAILGLAGCQPSDVSDLGSVGQRLSSGAVEVCHEAPANNSGARDPGKAHSNVITVGSEAALLAHINHGDKVFGQSLNDDCSGGVRVQIDADLEPPRAALPGLSGGPPRPVAIMASSEGGRYEYIADEVRYQPGSADDLSDLVQAYGGEIVRDDSVLVATDDGVEQLSGIDGGWYLIRFDPDQSTLMDLPANLADTGFVDEIAFSSPEAARAVALRLREASQSIALNRVMESHAVLEHPTSNGYVDFEQLDYMSDDSDPNTPGDQGLSMSVVRAWNYLRDTGLPPFPSGEWRPATIAIIDDGFDLDPVTGLGNLDYNNNPFSPPIQVDLMDFDGRAGGPDDEGEWHGQEAFAACCAYPRNLFGGAGSGGNLVRPVLIRAGHTEDDMGRAIRSAWVMGVDVISISRGTLPPLDVSCTFCDIVGWFAGLFSSEDFDTQTQINQAVSGGSIVIASAGNGYNAPGLSHSLDVNVARTVPCILDNVICVGGVSVTGENYFNYGDGVDIWGIRYVSSTVTPISAAFDADDIGPDEISTFLGTSASAPFVAGIVGLMKAARPQMFSGEAQSILQSTANCGTPSSPCPVGVRDPKVSKGYVDALRAVQAVRDNPEPTVRIIQPADGSEMPWTNFTWLLARVEDPPAPGGFDGEVVFTSDLDQELCRVSGNSLTLGCAPSFAPVPSLGAHRITARATDSFGAVGETTIDVSLFNRAPSVAVLSPADGDSFFSSQSINLRARVVDPDAEVIGPANVTWTSSLDGVIPDGGTPENFATALSVGTHMLTVTATDAYGLSSQSSVGITVIEGAGKPTARIEAPASDTFFRPETAITLIGDGIDPEDGSLPDSSLQWSSSIDGPLGTGRTLEVTLSGHPCEGFYDHTITLQVTDSDGNVDTDTIIVHVGLIC